MIKGMGRAMLVAWSRTGRAPGYLYQAVDRCGPALAGRSALASRLPNGCRVHCDLRDEVQRVMWFFGAYEAVQARLFAQFLRPGLTVIDAGANVGQYTLLAATGVGPSGTVHAFEPVPETFARLQQNIADNALTNVRPNRAALWHADGPLRLGLPPQMVGRNVGSYSLGQGDLPSAVEAPGIRLDAYADAAGIDRVGLIKMDIEGAEPGALAGGRSLIERSRPVLFMEVARSLLGQLGSSPAALWRELSSLGYRAWRIGLSAATSGPISDLEGFEKADIIFHQEDLPPAVTDHWDLRAALRWARSGW
jgi:FkbM family methyltransferase